MDRPRIYSWLTDVRSWIAFFFLIRLVGITNPPLETGHNWRQCLTNMIARNFLEHDANMLYPRVDMAGDMSGIIGSEFPLFNYLIYLVSHLFGYAHWYGRLINLVVSSAGVYFFYRLVKEFVTTQAAFNATIILLASVWFPFSRKIMPDTFSIALVIIGLYYAYDYLRHGTTPRLILFFTFSTLGMLCKIPALSLFCVLSLVLFAQQVDLRRKLSLLTTAGLGFLVVCSWYFYWVPHLVDTYGYPLYFPKGFAEGIREILPLMPELLEKFYYESLHSYIAFAATLAGAVLIVKSKHRWVASGIGIITAIFVLFIIKTGSTFPLHGYYIIPYTPIMALMAGYALNRMPKGYQYVLLTLIAVESIANQQHDFFIKDSRRYRLELEEIAERVIPREDLVIINGGQSPQDIYFAHRKGWTVYDSDILQPGFVDSLVARGARHLIIDRTHFDRELIRYEVAYTDDHYAIYRLMP